MQLFLTLMLALLLKMEAAFFTGNAQMDEADLDVLVWVIIGTSLALVVGWIFSVILDIILSRHQKTRKKREEEESRERVNRFKRSQKLLKAMSMKSKIFAAQSSEQKAAPKVIFARQFGERQRRKSLARKNTALRLEQEKVNAVKDEVPQQQEKKDEERQQQQKEEVKQHQQKEEVKHQHQHQHQHEEGEDSSRKDSPSSLGAMQQEDILILRDIRRAHGPGSKVYIEAVRIMENVRQGSITPLAAAEEVEMVLKSLGVNAQQYASIAEKIRCLPEKRSTLSENVLPVPLPPPQREDPPSEDPLSEDSLSHDLPLARNLPVPPPPSH